VRGGHPNRFDALMGDDCKVAKAWEVYDECGMWRQLGVAPPTA
jgi:hypothetical protein